MNVTRAASGWARTAPPKLGIKDPVESRLGLNLSAVTAGSLVVDTGMAAAYCISKDGVLPGLGLGLAALHGARGAAFLMTARHQSGVTLQQRLGTFAGESMIAAGHLAGAAGAGALSVPLLAAGMVVNTVVDHRYRSSFGSAPEMQSDLSNRQLNLNGADAVLGLGTAAGLAPLGVVAGVGHAALAGHAYVSGSSADKHSRHCHGFGHALQAAGYLSGAAGAGPVAAVPILGGMLINSLQDLRDPR